MKNTSLQQLLTYTQDTLHNDTWDEEFVSALLKSIVSDDRQKAFTTSVAMVFSNDKATWLTGWYVLQKLFNPLEYDDEFPELEHTIKKAVSHASIVNDDDYTVEMLTAFKFTPCHAAQRIPLSTYISHANDQVRHRALHVVGHCIDETIDTNQYLKTLLVYTRDEFEDSRDWAVFYISRLAEYLDETQKSHAIKRLLEMYEHETPVIQIEIIRSLLYLDHDGARQMLIAFTTEISHSNVTCEYRIFTTILEIPNKAYLPLLSSLQKEMPVCGCVTKKMIGQCIDACETGIAVN